VPLFRHERPYFTEIIDDIRRGAESLEQHISTIDDQEIGGGWPEQDLLELYQAWLEVGNALRDLTRTQPTADATEARREVVAIRDGIRLITEIITRQV
jgi:hypothetical protein